MYQFTQRAVAASRSSRPFQGPSRQNGPRACRTCPEPRRRRCRRRSPRLRPRPRCPRRRVARCRRCGVLGVLRTVVFGGLRLLVSGCSARVRPRPGCGTPVPSGVAYDCRVGLDPRGNIFDGLFPCGGAPRAWTRSFSRGGVEGLAPRHCPSTRRFSRWRGGSCSSSDVWRITVRCTDCPGRVWKIVTSSWWGQRRTAIPGGLADQVGLHVVGHGVADDFLG